MDKLEHYLDQVCRGIAGPRALRLHIRQELREHLMDAVAEHESAGLPHEEATDRAIEEFGGPDEVRRELEATHGHRLMTLVVDKAMQWKEKTMKGKWLWVTWAHLALVLVIALEVLFILGAFVLVLPKLMEFEQLGWLDGHSPNANPVESWGFAYFRTLVGFMLNWVWVIPLAALWTFFEWRVRSENKSMIRLALMGTAAVKLMIITILTAAFMILPMAIEMPVMARRNPEPEIRNALAKFGAALPGLESAMTARDWNAVQASLSRVRQPLSDMVGIGASPALLLSMDQPQKEDALRARLYDAYHAVNDAQRGVPVHDATSVELAITKARAVLEQTPQIPPTTRP